ncbi:MAG: hypothetical protein JSS49_29670 [Planctomycetes bacterium]|nr:hypothetical protein [Planctomycetota bacterium]
MFRFVLLTMCLGLNLASSAPAVFAQAAPPTAEAIDFSKARAIFQKRQKGETLSADEEAYLKKAMAARAAGQNGNRPNTNVSSRATIGLKPLTEMSADDKYKGEDGGLYGGGRNEPPAAHARAAEAALKQVQPLNANGQPAADGRIVFVSISMSNATQEFSRFKQIADADAAKSTKLTIVDCAQGGQAMAEWAPKEARPWTIADLRIAAAGVTAKQVQVAWIKLANKGPRGDLAEHGRSLQRDTLAVIQNARERFPNLRIVYLSSRIYGGYATSALNPEPYAYESAFAARWLIQDQISGAAALNFNPDLGTVKAPVLLWGPYLWADGTTPRQADKLIYNREDLAGDGTHPSEAGRDKVARVMLQFFKSDSLAKGWFTR